jgi:hypothetical protein
MENQARDLLAQLYRQIVEDIPPEVGTRHLWELVQEVEDFLNPEE